MRRPCGACLLPRRQGTLPTSQMPVMLACSIVQMVPGGGVQSTCFTARPIRGMSFYPAGPVASQRRQNTPHLASCLLGPVPGEHRDPGRPLARRLPPIWAGANTWKGRCFQRTSVPLNTQVGQESSPHKGRRFLTAPCFRHTPSPRRVREEGCDPHGIDAIRCLSSAGHGGKARIPTQAFRLQSQPARAPPPPRARR